MKLNWIRNVGLCAAFAGALHGQVSQRSATMVGGGTADQGKCTIEVVVDGVAEVEFRSTAGTLRNRTRVLAVTSRNRDPSLPDVPSLNEAGVKNYDATFWFGLAAPTGTPQTIVNRLNALLRDAVSDAEVVKTLQRQGLNPAPSSPQELTARMHADYVKWKRVIDGS